ncbi:MAG: GNAT family N-acetyltransferase [Candidatus Micrarchaeota archaeon]
MDYDARKLEIRRAGKRELYSITVLTRRFFPYTGFNMEKIYKRLRTRRIYYYAALYDGHTVGFLDFKENAKSIKILGLAVLEEFRGRGIGQALLDVALGFARGKGKKSAFLLVAQQNDSASRLYERNGFKSRGRLAKKIWGMDVLLLAKEFG